MGRVLEGVKPADVFEFFEDIASIPHGSGNTDKISSYLENFAKKRNLKYNRDSLGNIVIFKDAYKGYEDHEPVIFQGHMDMVCEKDSGISKDMEKEGLDLYIEDGFLKARGTTLGGDDGIAVACGLALLNDKELPAPPLEVVFTVDEEIGMVGAAAFDCSVLKGRRMLNADSENEKELLCGCAGGATVSSIKKVERLEFTGKKLTVSLCGLTGGHSGCDADKQRGNANVIMGRILYSLVSRFDIRVEGLAGGTKDNAIPRECRAKLYFPDSVSDKDITDILDELKSEILSEYAVTDPDMVMEYEITESVSERPVTKEDSKALITLLYLLPCGIQKMSCSLEGMVQTSLNLGILILDEEKIRMSFCVRSSVSSEKKNLIDKIRCISDMCGATVEISGDYPGWEFKNGSPLQAKYIKAYKKIYGTEPYVCTVHAGVECGF